MITVMFTALGLAMDAFAASITSGTAIKHPTVKNAFTIGLSFGLFQAAMPLVGWLGGVAFRDFIEDIDHWIAFGLLSFIGFRMTHSAMKTESSQGEVNPLHFPVLLILSVATSIDALVVGVTFAFLGVSIAVAAMVIGIVTFLLSFLGVFLGNRFGPLFGNKIGIAGGSVLIGIGVKILLEHLGYI